MRSVCMQKNQLFEFHIDGLLWKIHNILWLIFLFIWNTRMSINCEQMMMRNILWNTLMAKSAQNTERLKVQKQEGITPLPWKQFSLGQASLKLISEILRDAWNTNTSTNINTNIESCPKNSFQMGKHLWNWFLLRDDWIWNLELCISYFHPKDWKINLSFFTFESILSLVKWCS